MAGWGCEGGFVNCNFGTLRGVWYVKNPCNDVGNVVLVFGWVYVYFDLF